MCEDKWQSGVILLQSIVTFLSFASSLAVVDFFDLSDESSAIIIFVVQPIALIVAVLKYLAVQQLTSEDTRPEYNAFIGIQAAFGDALFDILAGISLFNGYTCYTTGLELLGTQLLYIGTIIGLQTDILRFSWHFLRFGHVDETNSRGPKCKFKTLHDSLLKSTFQLHTSNVSNAQIWEI